MTGQRFELPKGYTEPHLWTYAGLKDAIDKGEIPKEMGDIVLKMYQEHRDNFGIALGRLQKLHMRMGD